MAAGPAPVELHADCTSCGLESGVVEIYDALVPACRFGLPARASCQLCGAVAAGTFEREPRRAMREIPANRCPACLELLPPTALDDRRCAACGTSAALVTTAPGRAFTSVADLAAALDAWAERDGFASRQALLEATFCHPVAEILYAFIVRKERLEVIADPFATMGMRPAGSATASAPRSTPAVASAPAVVSAPAGPPPRFDQTLEDPLCEIALASTDPLAQPLAPPPSAPPRAIVYPLVSVVAADGEIHPLERSLVDRFLQNEGLGPLTDEEFRVHHPSEVAHLVPKERRDAAVQLMCETAAADGLPDESERRVIRAYAAAWHVPDEKVDFWMWGYENMNASLARQLWLKIRRFVLSARWGSEPEERR